MTDRDPSLVRRSGGLSQYAHPLVLAAVFLVACSGCASNDFVRIRSIPRDPLAEQLGLVSRRGPRPTPRTTQFLRRYDLAEDFEEDPAKMLGRLQELIATEPTADKVYACAELAYVSGKAAAKKGDDDRALDLYAIAVTHAFTYLIDDRFGGHRNPYDPEFRRACDLYNGALESALRIARDRGQLRPGATHTVKSETFAFDVTFTTCGRWTNDEIERIEFVSDYEVKGLANQYRTYGLGVPLIAVRRQETGSDPGERFYPPRLSFPVTAFMRLLPQEAGQAASGRYQCVVELRDSLAASDVVVNDRLVPLQTDLSTPLAYFLNAPEFSDTYLATLGLIDAQTSRKIKGLYMLEPYDPHKIPVLLVHGLWSSPVTWVEMFNDLRAHPELRRNYQFWFYLYPTGQPFWVSAAGMREDLAHARAVLDPEYRAAALDRMVLVGHSMGGLVSKLQTLESGDDFWRIVSDKPFGDLRADSQVRDEIARVVYFRPNPSVRRVITIATPHRGSEFSNDFTQWLARKVIDLPGRLIETGRNALEANPDFFRDEETLSITTSIDSLSPDSPFLPVMLRSRTGPRVRYHNIVGVVPEDSAIGVFSQRISGRSDGVVSYESAHVEGVDSEITVPADHVRVHRHPRTVLEVQRILLEHLAEARTEYWGASRNARVAETQ